MIVVALHIMCHDPSSGFCGTTPLDSFFFFWGGGDLVVPLQASTLLEEQVMVHGTMEGASKNLLAGKLLTGHVSVSDLTFLTVHHTRLTCLPTHALIDVLFAGDGARKSAQYSVR
jgi:hypothetical protein